MNRNQRKIAVLAACCVVTWASDVFAQQYDSPANRMRPIGSPSAVDQYRRSGTVPTVVRSPLTSPSGLRETAYQNTGYQNSAGLVRQTAMQFEVPGGAGAFAPPAGPLTQPAAQPSSRSLPPGPVPQQSLPTQQAPLAQQFSPQQQPLPSLPSPPLGQRLDLAPMNQPVLSNQFATINNCAGVTGPSNYNASFGSACAPVGYQAVAPYQAPPAQIAAPALMPGGTQVLPGSAAIVAPAALNPAPIGSLLTFGQERYPVQVGQGILGQPKAYVPGQTVRNWLRYFTP